MPAPAAPAFAKAPVAPIVPKDPSADLVAALQQQSQVLSRLASELDARARARRRQGRMIAALEKKAGAAAAAPPAAPAPPPPVITVDTGGAKLRLAGLVQGWYTASNQGVADSFRLRRGENQAGRRHQQARPLGSRARRRQGAQREQQLRDRERSAGHERYERRPERPDAAGRVRDA
jgi:hypothetical protein